MGKGNHKPIKKKRVERKSCTRMSTTRTKKQRLQLLDKPSSLGEKWGRCAWGDGNYSPLPLRKTLGYVCTGLETDYGKKERNQQKAEKIESQAESVQGEGNQ